MLKLPTGSLNNKERPFRLTPAALEQVVLDLLRDTETGFLHQRDVVAEVGADAPTVVRAFHALGARREAKVVGGPNRGFSLERAGYLP